MDDLYEKSYGSGNAGAEEQLREALERWFGYRSFLDHQLPVMKEVFSGKDVCVVMPTGAGKSLCYQLPLLLRSRYSIIVSPLISLMKDQVDSLKERHIPAAFINTTVPPAEQYAILREAEQGGLKLLYVAPERFQAPGFLQFLRENPPEALIVDEVHCISQWGHDFRPSYMKLGTAAEELGIPQVCAFTATATRTVQKDIAEQLKRREMKMMVAGFKRPNLAFSVAAAHDNATKNRIIARLLKEKAPTIIYASTRKAVESLQEEFGCIAYHGGMSDEMRTEAQEKFMREPAPVLAATNAFGMGIDRPDVRRVIHYNIPGSIEAYYQEAGRAGRDGEPAECILLYGNRDRYIHEFLIDMNNPEPETVRSLYAYLQSLWKKNGGVPLEITLAEFAARIPSAKSDSAVGAAFAILEENGYVSRSYSREGSASFRIAGDLELLKEKNAGEQTQRARFLHRVIQHYGAAASCMNKYSMRELSELCGLPQENIRRILSALDGISLEQEKEEYRGASTSLLRPDDPLTIDFTRYKRKRELEYDRLEDMLSYANAPGCRQRFLISYFGENADQWECGVCDRCSAHARIGERELTPEENAAAHTILSSVRFFNGQLGRGRLSQILAGMTNAETASSRYSESPCFGIMKPMKQNLILTYLRELEEKGFLERCGNPEYPCLALSEKGRNQLSAKKPLSLVLPEQKTKKKSVPSAPARTRKQDPAREDDGGLLDRLKALRMKLAAKRRVPAYMVLQDKALEELARRRPSTVQEAEDIPGIGPAKLASYIPVFLREIAAFSEEEE